MKQFRKVTILHSPIHFSTSVGFIDEQNNKILVEDKWTNIGKFDPTDPQWQFEDLFEENDTVFWDSNFGYEIGTYLGPSPAFNLYKFKSLTGNYQGNIGAVPLREIKPYTEKEYNKLIEKYKYKKTIND